MFLDIYYRPGLPNVLGVTDNFANNSLGEADINLLL